METSCRCGTSRRYHNRAGACMPGAVAVPLTAACHALPPRTPRSPVMRGAPAVAKSMTRPRNHGSRARSLQAMAGGRGLLRPATCEAFQSATALTCARTSCGRKYVSSAVGGTGTPGGHAGSTGAWGTGGVRGSCTRSYAKRRHLTRSAGGWSAAARSVSGGCTPSPASMRSAQAASTPARSGCLSASAARSSLVLSRSRCARLSRSARSCIGAATAAASREVDVAATAPVCAAAQGAARASAHAWAYSCAMAQGVPRLPRPAMRSGCHTAPHRLARSLSTAQGGRNATTTD
eukprot:458355-Pleurochrysis_carterae.AAC.1